MLTQATPHAVFSNNNFRGLETFYSSKRLNVRFLRNRKMFYPGNIGAAFGSTVVTDRRRTMSAGPSPRTRPARARPQSGHSNMAGLGLGQSFSSGERVVHKPSTDVELRIACRNLLDLDLASRSDPVCVVYLREMYSDKYTEIARTEVIKNTLNPDFVRPIQLNYSFEEHQKLRFVIYDYDVKTLNLAEQDYLGQIECSLGEIVAYKGSQFRRILSGSTGTHCGTIIISAEAVSECKEILVLQFSATNLDKKDLFGKSDPFLVLSKLNADDSSTVVHKTEVIKNTIDPVWRAFSVPVRVLCNGDLERTIHVECYDWDSDGGHDLIGEFDTTAQLLMKGPCEENIYECINLKKKEKKSGYENSGVITLNSCTIDREHSFFDFVKGGLQMNFTVAIDFTGSNGNPKSRDSLHYIHPKIPNSYAVAIRAVGDIIQDYDSNKQFPALGFGARVPPHYTVSHKFFLTGQPSNPCCQGVDGILEHYNRTLKLVQLYGPTNFAPSINHVARIAATVKDGSMYHVLLIITDGEISDMQYTKRAIVHASSLPMSIIIVGVGQADFKAMEELDCDGARLRSPTGDYAQRDIVQFVPLRNFQIPNTSWQQSQARLAKKVLSEIPSQVVEYMKFNNFVPKEVPAEATTPSAPPPEPQAPEPDPTEIPVYPPTPEGDGNAPTEITAGDPDFIAQNPDSPNPDTPTQDLDAPVSEDPDPPTQIPDPHTESPETPAAFKQDTDNT